MCRDTSKALELLQQKLQNTRLQHEKCVSMPKNFMLCWNDDDVPFGGIQTA